MNSKSPSPHGLIFLLLAVVAIWLLSWALIWLFFSELQERGQFGDLFGSVNALFSGLAFGALIYTILQQQRMLELQQQQLHDQREDLRRQRDEARSTREELRSQVEAQRALYRATAAQVRVASITAQIQREDFDSTHIHVSAPGGKERNEGRLNALLSELDELASKLEAATEA